MEHNASNGRYNQDILSQSYSQGIEKIARTENKYVFDFHIPKEIIEEREKSWDSLFDKYSEQITDEIELNINTLKPEVLENEEQYSGHRVCMRKPLSVVQYWVDTGNLPYKAYLCESDQSASGSSLSEKECSTLQLNLPELGKHVPQKNNEERSSTSVDTAVYILSNANVTKKADTMAIVEGAKSSNMALSESGSDKMLQLLTVSKNGDIHGTHSTNDNCNSSSCRDIGIDTGDIKEIVPRNHVATDAKDDDEDKILPDDVFLVMPVNDDDNKEIDQTNKVHSILASGNNNILEKHALEQVDIMSNATTVRNVNTVKDGGNNVSDINTCSTPKIGIPCTDCFSPEAESCDLEMETIYSSQQNLDFSYSCVKPFRRKKLFTNRNSPIDLISMSKQCKNDIPSSRLSIHPAFISGIPAQKEKHKVLFKRKKQSFRSPKRNRKSNGETTDNLHNNSIHSSVSAHSRKSSLHNSHLEENLKDKRVLEELRQTDKAPVKKKNIDLKLVTKIPVVCLERIPQKKLSRLLKKNRDSRKNSTSNKVKQKVQAKRKYSGKIRTYSYEVQKIDTDTVDSDQSTILICQCNNSEPCLRSPFESLSSTSDSSLKDVDHIQKKTKEKGLNVFETIIKEKLSPLVLVERLKIPYSVKNEAKSKQDLTKRSSQYDISSCDTYQINSDIRKIDSNMCNKAHVALERLPSQSFSKSPISLNNVTQFSQRPSRITRKSEHRRDENHRKEDIVKRRKKDNRYSFLHLPSSDDETEFTKLIERVHSNGNRRSRSKNNATTGRENSFTTNNKIVRKNGNLSVNGIVRTQGRMSSSRISTFVVSSSDGSMSEVGDKKRPRRNARVPKDALTSKKKRVIPAAKSKVKDSDQREKIEGVAESVAGNKDEERTDHRSLRRTSARLLRRSIPLQNSSSAETEESGKNAHLLSLRKQSQHTDSDSEGFLSFINTKHKTSTTKVKTGQSQQKKTSSPRKSQRRRSTKHRRKTFRNADGTFMSTKTWEMISKNSVCRNLKYSDTSDSDESLKEIMKIPSKSDKRSSIRLGSDKSPAEIKEDPRTSSGRENYETPVREMASQQSNQERTSRKLFKFRLPSDDEGEILFKKAKRSPQNEALNYLKVDSTAKYTLGTVEDRQDELEEHMKDNEKSQTTLNPLIFQTRTSYESDSD